jgi:hypothetical protein
MRLTSLLLAALPSIGIVGSTATYASATPSRGADVQLIKKGKKHKLKKHHKRLHKKKHAANT